MKKVALVTLITSLIIWSLIGVFIVVFDFWNDATARIFLSLITIFGFSFPCLACSIGIEKAKNKIIPVAGLTISIIGCLYILLLLWKIINFDLFNGLMWKIMFTTITLSASLAHMSLLLLINSSSKTVNIMKWTTIVLSLFVDLFILLSIYDVFSVDFKLFDVACILVALGTLITPLMHMSTKLGTTKVKGNNYQQLEQLKSLLDSGAITQEEYNKEKEKLLNK